MKPSRVRFAAPDLSTYRQREMHFVMDLLSAMRRAKRCVRSHRVSRDDVREIRVAIAWHFRRPVRVVIEWDREDDKGLPLPWRFRFFDKETGVLLLAMSV